MHYTLSISKPTHQYITYFCTRVHSRVCPQKEITGQESRREWRLSLYDSNPCLCGLRWHPNDDFNFRSLAQQLSWAHVLLPNARPMRFFNVLLVANYAKTHVDHKEKFKIITDGMWGHSIKRKDEEDTSPTCQTHQFFRIREMTVTTLVGYCLLIVVLSNTFSSGDSKQTNPFQDAVQKKLSLERLDHCFCEVCNISNYSNAW